jgi:hypothetical protein
VQEFAMFRIKREQMEFFNAKTREKFCQMMVGYLRESFTEWVEVMSPEALNSWVEAAVDKADSYRVRTEPEAAQLILLFLLLGIEADKELEWFGAILESRTLAAEGKVRRLIRTARANEVEDLEQVIVYAEFDAAHPSELTD